MTWREHQRFVYIDACQSGSAIDEAKIWAVEKGGSILYQEHHYSECRMQYFNTFCQAILKIITSCAAKEHAADTVNDQGGLWTNYFVAKGIEPIPGKKFFGTKPDNSQVE